jgi:predicted ATP-dependent protease
VQAIGGVNQKIEGFFDVCRFRQLTGSQGVLIPADNVQHLMLRHDVVDAIRAGQFQVYPVHTADEALGLLSGLETGERAADGQFDSGSFNRLVDEALRKLAEQRRAFSAHEGGAEREGE